ncbi:MAG: hypothetical protein AAF560_14200 [Acidobacteriota bacterium]
MQQDPRVALGIIFTIALASSGCRSAMPNASITCSRVALEPAPPWTASAAWSSSGDELVLVDPGSRGLATYGRDGKRVRNVRLDETVKLDYAEPMRLERTAEGFAVIDKRRVLSFDHHLALDQREQPFAALETRGYADASFNDVVRHRGHYYGYADFVEPTAAVQDNQETEDVDSEGSSTWRRGFVRLDPDRGNLELLHELPVDSADGEYANYYFYDRRPYIAELGKRVFVLRFTEPWSVHRVNRRGLSKIASGPTDGGRAYALQSWNGRLYVLTRRIVPKADAEEQPTTVKLAASGKQAHLELLQALPALQKGERQWILHEIDPRGGQTLRRVLLPSTAGRLHLIPGRSFWTAIEESSIPNLGESDAGTNLLFLPASELLSGHFGCPREEPVPESKAQVAL